MGEADRIPTRGDAIVLRHRLAERGIAVSIRDERLWAGPADLLTAADREAVREHRHALYHLLNEPGLGGLAEDIAGRRRALMDDQGYPLCPDCGRRARANGVRTCPACLAAARAA